LAAQEAESELSAIRQRTHTERPLGTPEFVKMLEATMQRRLARQTGGRPAKSHAEEGQESLAFGE
jgi:hypothetical protein